MSARPLPLLALAAGAIVAVAGLGAAAGADRNRATAARTAPRPPIVQSRIPFGATRKAQMRRYARRHYGIDTYALRKPRVIVEHFTGSDSYSGAYNTFAANRPDVELHELPGVCAHFLIDRRGVIHQLVSVRIMCRHTVGLNWTAIGIEHVGTSDAEVIGNHRQLTASLRLTRWLQGSFGIRTRNVIGHSESLRSPYHRERVPALQHQTHADFSHATMGHYRKWLASGRAAASRSGVIGRSVRGRPIAAIQRGDPRAAHRVLVVGAIHGNETAGIAVTRRLRKAPLPAAAGLCLVDAINPDGVAAHTRQNAHGVDLNRNFPWGWRPLGRRGDLTWSGTKPSSEPETRAARTLIRRFRPSVTVWFHQPLALVDRSGGDVRIERRFARLARLPLRRITPYPGTATRWQNHRFPGATAFVVELPRGPLSSRRLDRLTNAVLDLLR
jgi:N-acetylmuramoyl-L-alanine amidase-like protein/succinylglutamate desuccinylase/aspartoacylase family protein